MQLLPAQRRALVLLELFEEAVRQVRLVVERRAAHNDAVGLRLGQLADQLARLGRRRPQHLRLVAQTQAHHGHIPRLAVVLPRRQLVEPAARVLRAAQPLGLFCGEAADRGHATRNVSHLDDHVGLVVFDKQIGRQHGQDAALALEARELDVLIRRRDHAAVEAARILEHGARDPLRADARLAEASPGQIAALRPVGRGRKLRRARCGHPPLLPVEVAQLVRRQLGQLRLNGLGAAHSAPERYSSSASRSCRLVSRIRS